jgi:predicted  nucleic acid-binding Zn-ribbon protein
MSDELRKRQEEHSPHRLAYYERTLNRIASEVGGNAAFQADRIAGIMTEIDGVRKEVTELRESLQAVVRRKEVDELRESIQAVVKRIDRMAEFLTELKKHNGDVTSKPQDRKATA